MKALLTFILGLCFSYWCGAFVFTSLDITTWGIYGRTIVLLVGVLMSGFVAAAVGENT